MPNESFEQGFTFDQLQWENISPTGQGQIQGSPVPLFEEKNYHCLPFKIHGSGPAGEACIFALDLPDQDKIVCLSSC